MPRHSINCALKVYSRGSLCGSARSRVIRDGFTQKPSRNHLQPLGLRNSCLITVMMKKDKLSFCENRRYICNFSLDSHIPPFGHCQRHLGFKHNPERQHQNQHKYQHQHQLSFTSTSIPLKYFLSKTCVAKRCSHWYKWTSSYPVMTFSAPGGKFPYWGISFVRTIITSQSPPHSRPTSAYLRKECEQGVSGNSKVHRWQDIP